MSQSPSRATFTLFGFPVRVRPFFFLVVLFLGAPRGEEWTQRVFAELAIWMVVVFAAILLHELGHAWVMRHYGFSPSIELHGLGGATAWGRGPARPTAAQRVAVSLAGPAAGIAVGIPLIVLDAAGGTSHWALAEAMRVGWWTTLGWGVLNLVPMLPWDGGHALEGAVDYFAEGRGRRVAAVVTFAVAGCAIAAAWLFIPAGALWITLLCVLSITTAYRALTSSAADAAVHELDPNTALEQARKVLEDAARPPELVAAILLGSGTKGWAGLADELETSILPRVGSGEQRAAALELIGWARLLSSDPDRAHEAARQMRPSHDPSPLLEGLIAVRQGRFEDALDALDDGFDHASDDPESVARVRLEAYALAALGRTEEAIARLGKDHSSGAVVDGSLFRAAYFDAAAALGERLFERFGAPEDAYNAACAHARAGRAEMGLRWLERAVDAGFEDIGHLEGDADLAAVRALDEYALLRERRLRRR